MKWLSLDSPAKINLFLEVIANRQDGYHDIETVFERIDLCDKITLTEKPAGLSISCSDKTLENKDNLAYKAAVLLSKKFRPRSGAHIHIEKRIPVGAGLGGGSSNAASALVGLNRLWRLGLSRQELVGLADKLGSDVGFFIMDKSFALGKDRGNLLIPIESKAVLWHVLVKPKISVSTKVIYGNLVLTYKPRNAIVMHYALAHSDFNLIIQSLFNRLQPITAKRVNAISCITRELESFSKSVLMSGSGSTVYAVLRSKGSAIDLKKKILKANSSWEVFVARTK